MIKYNCPVCRTNKVKKNGRDFRTSDSRYVQRYKCKECGKYFSSATFQAACNQNKRRLNNTVYKLFSHGMSMRNIASFLNISRTTVAAKLEFIAGEARKKNEKFLKSKKAKIDQVVFDEMLTHEHTKCKPLSVAMAVEKHTGFILGFRVSQSPATGKLSAISKNKYGPRPNEERQGLEGLFKDITPYLKQGVLIESDKKVMYRNVVKKTLRESKIKFEHITYNGEKCKERGQGEMVNHARKFDTLFWINHTFAVLRYRASRLIRKTWCNTKKQINLEAHLHLLVHFLNQKIESEL